MTQNWSETFVNHEFAIVFIYVRGYFTGNIYFEDKTMSDFKVTLVKTTEAKGTGGFSYEFKITDKDGNVTGQASIFDPDRDGPCGVDGINLKKGTISATNLDDMIKLIGKGYKSADGLNENPTGEKYEDLGQSSTYDKNVTYTLGSVYKALHESKTSNSSSSSVTNPFASFLQGGGFPMLFNNGATSLSSMNFDYNMFASVMSQGANLFSGLAIGSYMSDFPASPFMFEPAIGGLFAKLMSCATPNTISLPTMNSALSTNNQSISSTETNDKTISENTDVEDKELKEKGLKEDKENEIDEEVDEKVDEEVDEALDDEAHEICKAIYTATDGLGTDDDKLEAAIGAIKPENVLRVMEVWKETYAKKADGKSLIQVINDDTEHDPSWSWLVSGGTATMPKDNQEYILPIKEAMLVKAKPMKINRGKLDDFDMEVEDQYKTRNRWGGLIGGWSQDSKKIDAAFDDMYKAMESQKNKKGKTTKKETNKETEKVSGESH